MKNRGYAKFWGANKVHYGKCGSGILSMQIESWLVDEAQVALIRVSMNKDDGQPY